MLALLDSEIHIHNSADSARRSPARTGAGSWFLRTAARSTMSDKAEKPAYVLLRIRRRLTLYAGMAAAGAAFYAIVH